jgi:polyvinyl alcohol dehydrogenase (cytochrome)
MLACTTPAIAATDGADAADAAAALARRSTESGFILFQQHCVSCHGNPVYERAPSPAALRAMPPERIYDALRTGVMKAAAASLSDGEQRLVAESLAGRFLGSAQAGDANSMPNRCPGNPPLASIAGPAWNGWGNGLANDRFQSSAAAGLTATNVAQLKLRWAFGFPGGTSAYGQPSAVAGRVFVGTDTGFVYSLDAATGCIYWSFHSLAGVRNAMTVGPIKASGHGRYAVYFGDIKANVYALDAQSGEQIWSTHVGDHFTARVTAAPALYAGRLYVPISSWEGISARIVDYPCCTAVGSVNALDANTGKLIWTTHTIGEPPHPTHRNSLGVQQWAPAGVPVWNTPTVDPPRNAVYVGTGDASTYPAPRTSDAILALQMTTGRVLWSQQVHRNDSFLVGCADSGRTENCPKIQGPDWDIPMSPMLKRLADGRRRILFGTKPGDILALDPDRRGAVLWRVDVFGDPIAGDGPVPRTRANRGPLWGGALDDRHAYFGLSGGGVAALDIASGERLWYTPLNSTPEKRVTHSAALSVVPGLVFVAGSDGRLWALSSTDGSALWSYDTAREFATVNKVFARGGSISSAGPTVADGMVFVGSGYGVVSQTPGNVLLAFTVH